MNRSFFIGWNLGISVDDISSFFFLSLFPRIIQNSCTIKRRFIFYAWKENLRFLEFQFEINVSK
jgi:hypothetical protein